jgi:rhamnogalacturonan endolyase
MITKSYTPKYLAGVFSKIALASLVAVGLFVATPAFAAFGLTTATDYYQVDTGAGLVFKVRRTDNGSNTQSAGDIMSLVWNGVEYQNQTRGSQITSGFDYLYTGVSAVSVSAAVVNTSYIKVTVQAGNLTHYYMARSGYPHIYMATYFTSEPDIHGLVRYIFRIPATVLPNGPTPSDIRNVTTTIESSDVFALSNGQTRSKHYSNMRVKDWSYIGATGSGVGMWVVRDNNEGASGGPFYRCLLNQCGGDQEITYIVNYGETQTEAFRTGILNAYTFVATTGGTPSTSIDTTWFSSMGLNGYLAASGRGKVSGVGISGRDTAYTYTVGFSNSAAQYWTTAAASNGAYTCAGMRPGTYTMKIYKNELVVWTGSATVTAGGTLALNTITITADPSSQSVLWRIGNWDGTPTEFRNGSSITTMHPQDPRLSSWTPGTYVVGSSGNSNFPCYQWKGVNGSQAVQFSLTAAQAAAARTLRIGITVAYANARPVVTVNGWTSAVPAVSTQPSTRSLTIGSYRGNNTTYTYSIPASAFVTGTNTLTIAPASGSGGSLYLSAGYSIDCVDFY